jgi:hypothetical protein
MKQSYLLQFYSRQCYAISSKVTQFNVKPTFYSKQNLSNKITIELNTKRHYKIQLLTVLKGTNIHCNLTPSLSPFQ